MNGTWLTIGLALIMLAGFASVVIAGVAVVHVSYRWWLMIMCGTDWDDAGALIRAKYRKRHGMHRIGDEASWPQAGKLPRADEQPVLPQGPPVAQRLSGVTQLLPLPLRPAVRGRPPWEDQTQIVPQAGNAGTETWLAPGGGLDRTVQMPQIRDDRRG